MTDIGNVDDAVAAVEAGNDVVSTAVTPPVSSTRCMRHPPSPPGPASSDSAGVEVRELHTDCGRGNCAARGSIQKPTTPIAMEAASSAMLNTQIHRNE